MPYGYPDWRPPGLGAGNRSWNFVELINTGDIIASPGAGLRIVVHFLYLVSSAAFGISVQEVTAANVNVRQWWTMQSLAGVFYAWHYAGVPLGVNNHLRDNGGAGANREWGLVYTTEQT